MGITPDSGAGAVQVARNASERFYFPKATIKCEGSTVFRSQCARDISCLLDVDPAVRTWSCVPSSIEVDGRKHVPDFAVFDCGSRPHFLDAPDRPGAPETERLRDAADRLNFGYEVMPRADLYSGFRLRNAKDPLRYGNYGVALGDRIRLLAALEEHGSLAFAECLTAFQETKPVAGLCSLVLSGFLEIDLDAALIGPSTQVRAIAS